MGNLPTLSDLLSAIVLPTVILDKSGAVIAASASYSRLLGNPIGKAQRTSDTKLKTAFEQIVQQGDAGEQRINLPLGVWNISWQRIANTGFTVLNLTSQSSSSPAYKATEDFIVAAGASTWELPRPDQTLALLGRAITACASAEASLALARLHPSLEGSDESLHISDIELWRNLGRRLRATCRVSDLVGVTKEGDFLIILPGAGLNDTQTVTRRVLGQLGNWLRQSVPVAVAIAAGYATWKPADGAVEPAVLVAKTGVGTPR